MKICNIFDRFDTIVGVKGVKIEIGTLVPLLLIISKVLYLAKIFTG